MNGLPATSSTVTTTSELQLQVKVYTHLHYYTSLHCIPSERHMTKKRSNRASTSPWTPLRQHSRFPAESRGASSPAHPSVVSGPFMAGGKIAAAAPAPQRRHDRRRPAPANKINTTRCRAERRSKNIEPGVSVAQQTPGAQTKKRAYIKS